MSWTPVSRLAVGVVAVVTVAGCTTGRGVPTSVTSGPPSTVAEATSTTGASSGGTLPEGVVVPKVPQMEPIGGYGDFSGVSYVAVDWFEVTALEVQCANDQGVPVHVIPPGDGIGYGDVASGQQTMAAAVIEACRAGLRLPPYEPPTRDQLTRLYYDLVDTRACLEGEGYTIAEPPTLDTFIDSYTTGDAWSPYLSLPDTLTAGEWGHVERVCPQPRMRP